MYIGKEFVVTHHVRTSKRGKVHTYGKRKTVLVLQCDNCGEVFKRDRGDMDPNRITNRVYHVCSNCDAKKFAQEKGVEARKIWDMPVSSLKTLDQL
jgi:hypothetical protein